MASQSVFELSVHDLMHKPGQMRELKLDITIPAALGNAVTAVPAGEIIDLDLRLESVHEGILVTGEVFGDAAGECSRCLEPLTVAVEVDFQELFAYSLSSEDDFAVQEEKIDLEQAILDAVVLNLPFKPICNETCLGLCASCGERMADDPHHVHEAEIDSRWSELKKLKED